MFEGGNIVINPDAEHRGILFVIPDTPARLWRDRGSSLDSRLSAKGRSASGGRGNDMGSAPK